MQEIVANIQQVNRLRFFSHPQSMQSFPLHLYGKKQGLGESYVGTSHFAFLSDVSPSITFYLKPLHIFDININHIKLPVTAAWGGDPKIVCI